MAATDVKHIDGGQYYYRCLIKAREWRTGKGLDAYRSYYWTPALGRRMAEHWLQEAARVRRFLLIHKVK